YRAHRRSVLSVLSIRDTEFSSHFFKRAVALVVEEKILGLIVGDIDVGISIAVVVCRRDAHGAAFVGADSGLIAHVGKCSVAVIVVETVRLGGVVKWTGIIVGGVVVAILGIELHITADKQIDTAVDFDARFFGAVLKGSVAAVAIKNRSSVAGDE